MACRRLPIVVLPLALAACGGGGGGGGSPVASTPPPAFVPAPAPPPPAPVSFDTAEYRRSNGVAQANAIAAYRQGATGAGITVGIIDSGIDAASPEFAGRISLQSGDFAGNRGLQDEGGHGTAVASVLLAAKNGRETHGVAFDATLLVLRTDTPGSCTRTGEDEGCNHSDAAIARGVDRAVAAGARVVNVSLGGSAADPQLRAAIGRATAQGVIFVFSAGNQDGEGTPAANPNEFAQVALTPEARGLILVAGATDANRTIADFSDRAGNAANVYLTALGVDVRGIDQTGDAFLFSGTSFSAPIVAGAAALLAQAFPGLSSAQIVDLLLTSTTDLGTPGTDAIYGRGELDLERAFAPRGATSLSATAAPVSLTANATLSAPMGDAGQGGMSVGIRDGYGRAYTVDLAPTIARTGTGLRLAPALLGSARGFSGTAGAAAFAVSVEGAGAARLTGGEAAAARVLAGSAAARLGATQLAFGIAAGGETLSRGLAGRYGPAFLIAHDGDGLARTPGQAVAVRHAIGRFAITAAAETGDLRLWQTGVMPGWRRMGYASLGAGIDGGWGPLTASLRMTRLDEDSSVLGAAFGPAFGPGTGAGGAATWFADAGAALDVGGWRAAANLRRGWTRSATGELRAASLAIDVARALPGGGSVALRWAEPLRVTHGSVALGEAVLDLAPRGRGRDLEAALAMPLATGWLDANAYRRVQPGHVAAAPDDLGVALRYRLAF